jgi:hypothetical protein
MDDDLGHVTVRLADGTAERYDAAELLANGVLKVSKTTTPAPGGALRLGKTMRSRSPTTRRTPIAATPSTKTQETTKRGLYIRMAARNRERQY